MGLYALILLVVRRTHQNELGSYYDVFWGKIPISTHFSCLSRFYGFLYVSTTTRQAGLVVLWNYDTKSYEIQLKQINRTFGFKLDKTTRIFKAIFLKNRSYLYLSLVTRDEDLKVQSLVLTRNMIPRCLFFVSTKIHDHDKKYWCWFVIHVISIPICTY